MLQEASLLSWSGYILRTANGASLLQGEGSTTELHPSHLFTLYLETGSH